jgi:hypothetical protein
LKPEYHSVKGVVVDAMQAEINELRAELDPLKRKEPFCYLYFERGEAMFSQPDGYRPDDAQGLYLSEAAKPADLYEAAIKADNGGMP